MIRIAGLVDIVTIQKKVRWGTSPWGTSNVYFRDESQKNIYAMPPWSIVLLNTGISLTPQKYLSHLITEDDPLIRLLPNALNKKS
jgi:hypothetical protein